MDWPDGPVLGLPPAGNVGHAPGPSHRPADLRAVLNRPLTVLEEPRSEPSERAFTDSCSDTGDDSPSRAMVTDPPQSEDPRPSFCWQEPSAQSQHPVDDPKSVADPLLDTLCGLPHQSAALFLDQLLQLQDAGSLGDIRDPSWPCPPRTRRPPCTGGY